MLLYRKTVHNKEIQRDYLVAMIASRSLKGRVLYQSSEKILVARGKKLFVSFDQGVTFDVFAVMPVGFIKSLIFLSSLACRLLRYGYHHIGPADDGYFVIFNKSAYYISDSGVVEELGHELIGGRPLCVSYVEGWCYYGEYISNESRRSVSINRFNRASHETVANVSGVRHVHGVFYDPYDECMWFSTGDSDTESGLWKLIDGRPEMVIGGRQVFRAVQLIFTKEHIYYGTDTPLEKNVLCRVARCGRDFERLNSVSSSVFYGAKVGHYISFATVVEPSNTNKTRYVEVWVSSNAKDWSCVMSFKKDIFPMKLFQYGQVTYPFVDKRCDFLWVYAMSVWGGGKSYRLPIH